MKLLIVLLWGFGGLLLSGCQETPTITPTTMPPTTCGPTVVTQNDSALTCLTPESYYTLLQSQINTQVALQLVTAQITFNGTVALTQTDQYFAVVTLEGSSIVSANGVVRVGQPGHQINLIRQGNGGIRGNPSLPQPISEALLALPFESLPRPIEVSHLLANTAQQSEALNAAAPAATTAPCTPREDWTERYTVINGDTLLSIARRYGTGMTDLQRGNCLLNANLLQVGQELRVPSLTATPTEPPATPTPSAIALRADQTTLTSGACTTIRWDVDNVSAVYFQGAEVALHDTQTVCPIETTDYRLRVVYFDETETTRTLTLTVTAP